MLLLGYAGETVDFLWSSLIVIRKQTNAGRKVSGEGKIHWEEVQLKSQ